MERIVSGIVTHRDAELTIKFIKELIRDYGQATMADLKEFLGESSTYEDAPICWDAETFKHPFIDCREKERFGIYLMTDEEFKKRYANSIFILV